MASSHSDTSGQQHLERQMSSRHMLMLSLGGVIGTGLFLSSGYTINQAGPLGTVLAYGLGALAMFGALPLRDGGEAPGFSNIFADGLFPNGFTAVFTVMLTVNFAFSGTELIGVAAGEAKDPEQSIPRAIHGTLWRLAIFFVVAIVVMSALIPYQSAGVEQSPFVTVFEMIGVPYAADLMNFVIITAILSAANSGLYASTRMLWSLANEGMIPQQLASVNRFGVPFFAMCISMVGGLLALLSSVVAAGTVYLLLVSVSGLAVVLVWISIAASHIVFRKRYLAEGKSLADLAYKAPGYPWTSWAALILSSLSCILIVFDETQRPALYYTVPFVVACYLAHRIFIGKRDRVSG